jgi:hypothetical protein
MNNIGDCKKEKDDNIYPPGSFNILTKKEKKTIKIPLIGEYNQIWYPTVNDFNLDKIKQIDILEYKDENEQKSNEFLKIFNSPDQKCDFISIGNLFIQEAVFNKIFSILKILPNSISSQVYKDIKPVTKENISSYNNKIKKVIKHNILLSFYNILKNRYDELEQNGFRELLTKGNLEDFNQKVEEMRKKYFCIIEEPVIKNKIKDELSDIKELIKKEEKKN